MTPPGRPPQAGLECREHERGNRQMMQPIKVNTRTSQVRAKERAAISPAKQHRCCHSERDPSKRWRPGGAWASRGRLVGVWRPTRLNGV
jgi:hypothetical protein